MNSSFSYTAPVLQQEKVMPIPFVLFTMVLVVITTFCYRKGLKMFWIRQFMISVFMFAYIDYDGYKAPFSLFSWMFFMVSMVAIIYLDDLKGQSFWEMDICPALGYEMLAIAKVLWHLAILFFFVYLYSRLTEPCICGGT